MSETEGHAGSFIRWQAYRIAQLTIATNLVLGLSVAVLGYLVSFILNPNARFQPYSMMARLGLVTSLFFIGGSLALGLWLVLNRMGSFRATARAARLREKKRPAAEIEPYRARYITFDRMTWCLFYSQLWTFAIGTAFAFLSIVLPAACKFVSGATG